MTHPETRPGPPDLEVVEREIRQAIDGRQPDRVELVGQGEFSLAIRWSDGEDRVVKRVPPFRSEATADQYCAIVTEYLRRLAERGVRCVATDTLVHRRRDGTAVVYLSQPLLDPRRLASQILRTDEPDPEHPVVGGVIDAVVGALGHPVGIDPQLANWYWHDDEPWHLDFSTPIVLDEVDSIRFDPWGFAREYPAALRPLVRRELLRLAPEYVKPDYVLRDLTANLFREGLDAWAPAVVEAIGRRASIDIAVDDARTAYERDARLFPLLQRLRRLQRAWIQRTERRYDSLLPTTSNY